MKHPICVCFHHISIKFPSNSIKQVSIQLVFVVPEHILTLFLNYVTRVFEFRLKWAFSAIFAIYILIFSK